MDTLAVDDIDEYLGPAESRFFGSGYRKAEHSLSRLTYEKEAICGTLTVRYPADWSKKKAGIDLRPHLSTVDTMVLAVDLTDALLVMALHLTPEQRAASRICKIVIQAGTRPEEDLGAVPVEARVLRTKALDGGFAETTCMITVGQMRARCTIAHPGHVVSQNAFEVSFDLATVLGPRKHRYWGEGFRNGQQSIRSVFADIGLCTADALIGVDEVPAHVVSGIGGRPKGPTPVDAFVGILQLVQVLLYEMDGVPRTESNTLWMQQTVIEVSPDTAPGRQLTAAITDSRLIDMPDGKWRNVEFEGSLGAIRQRSLFAHRLPESVTAPAA
ncbi:AvrD family protein [Paenarthrobacter sp. NPDC089675]|uniref:AvrD family protein n=1 Tax=Paenarthrobacter sp. NPDC089675 TaxID=3364376 RepID=UPI0037F2135A